MRKERKPGFFSKRNIVSLFIIFIMIFGFGGLVVDQLAKEKYEYNDFSFLLNNNKWVVNIDKNRFEFDFLPQEVENINLSAEILNRISNTLEIDSTYDLDSPSAEGIALVQYSLIQTLTNTNVFLRVGLTEENEFDLPVITCDDATEQIPVIYFKESNRTAVYLEDDCIIAEAKNDQEFLRIKDRLLYGFFGVIK